MESESSPEPRRPYRSPLRRAQAGQTRSAILEAARPLFIQRGYPGTSMGDIARTAGVSIKTVEAIFGTKARLLTALRDMTIVGDDAEIPVAGRVWFREMLQDPDPRRQLERFAQLSCQIKHRTAALNEVIRRAGQADREIGQLWQAAQDQLMADQRPVAESLAAKGALREGLDAADAADTLWLLNHPSVYYLAVFERDWPEQRFTRWLADTFIHQLLRQPPPGATLE
jgi:AcrR family transcriptional regulator